MRKLEIICIEDQREVLASLKKDLALFTDYFRITDCESADEAQEVMEDIDEAGDKVALIICDHIMPGEKGVDFLINVDQDVRFEQTKKILLTGLATHKDTITAINEAHIDHYIEKPWNTDELIDIVKILVTEYLIQGGIDYKPFMKIIDQQTLYRELRSKV